jgi:hypothetical protein
MSATTPTLTCRQKLDNVFDVLALSTDAIKFLTETGTVTTITRLINVGIEWFSTAIDDGEIYEADNSEITAFKILYTTKYLPEDDIVAQLTHDSWEKFCSTKTPGATVADGAASAEDAIKDTVKIKTNLKAIQDLQETNHEYDEVMKKITFPSGIRDP